MQRHTSFQEQNFSSGIEFFPALRYQNLQGVRALGLLLARNQWKSLSHSLTPKKIENIGEGNMETYAANSFRQDVCLQHSVHIRFYFLKLNRNSCIIAELKVNRSANFRDLCSALNCISCMLYFKAHLSVIIFYCFMF